MRKSTTNTEIRRIMKMHSNGLNAAEISQLIFVDKDAVQNVITVRTASAPKKETKKKVKKEDDSLV